jgi:hypothetical protein
VAGYGVGMNVPRAQEVYQGNLQGCAERLAELGVVDTRGAAILGELVCGKKKKSKCQLGLYNE